MGRAITELERRGCTADGQITATRSAGRTIAKVARARNVRYVVMDECGDGTLRRVIEGRQTREQALTRYASFNEDHRWAFEWLWRVQSVVSAINKYRCAP